MATAGLAECSTVAAGTADDLEVAEGQAREDRPRAAGVECGIGLTVNEHLDLVAERAVVVAVEGERLVGVDDP